MVANRPYFWYLMMRIPVNLACLMPVNLVAYYIKFVMAKESYIGIQSMGSMIFLFSAILAIGPLVLLCKRFERHRVLTGILAVQAICFFVIFWLPGEFMMNNTWVLFLNMAVVGIGTAAMNVVPDPMLADIIDYDELRTGDRSEAMYTVLEANLLQLVDIVGGVLPLLVIEAVGYASNGGCSCGCGVSCTQEEGMPYARWHCPSDVGFSCSGDLGSDLLFGGNRQAPCSIQNVE